MTDRAAPREDGIPDQPHFGGPALAPRSTRATTNPTVHGRAPEPASPALTLRKTRFFYLISFPIWAATAFRAADDTSGFSDRPARLAAGLLLIFAVLMASERPLRERFGWYPRLYFPVQAGLVLALMLLLPDLDYFAILYAPLSAQAMLVFPRPVGYRWLGVFTLVMATGLVYTQGWPESIAFILLYAAAFFFVASYAAVTEQAEVAREQSQALLIDLEEAYRQLEAYAAQAEALAVAEERNRLARDLHDSVTQALYGVTLFAEAAARSLAADEIDRAVSQLRELQETARQALQEMRLLLFELRSPVLEQEGLAAALQARLAAVEGRVGLATSLTVEGDGRLPPTVEVELDRITQVALNNALKHAHAHRITVHLHQDERSVALEITDDGVGFDPGAARTGGGLGLRGMAERAARIGGRLAVESRPGEGTRVAVEVPR
jgi:signal transduction histidine kinase